MCVAEVPFPVRTEGDFWREFFRRYRRAGERAKVKLLRSLLARELPFTAGIDDLAAYPVEDAFAREGKRMGQGGVPP